VKHEIKIELPYYEAVKEGRKTFEIRHNDRGYNAGDHLTLIPVRCGVKTLDPQLYAKIGYVTSWNQRENFVVFSLLNVKVEK